MNLKAYSTPRIREYLSLLLPILLISCGGKPSKNAQTEVGATPEVLQWLSFEGSNDRPHIVLISGDEEYRSEEALPQLAKILSEHHGFRCTVLFAQDPEKPGIIDPNFQGHIPGLHHLESADLMVIFTRFRALPDEQMQPIDNYLKAGKPVIGIRTATHAFLFKNVEMESSYRYYGNSTEATDAWKDGFGRLVLGEKWINHHGHHGQQSTRGVVAPGAADHPILNGVEAATIWGPSDVYGVRLPLPGDAQPLVLGQVVDRTLPFDEKDPLLGMRPTDSQLPGLVSRKIDDQQVTVDVNDPMMPIAWTKTYQLPEGREGKAFTSTMGASVDLLSEGTRRLFVNAVYFMLQLDVPEKAHVEFIGDYQPTRFAFYEDGHWDDKRMTVESLK